VQNFALSRDPFRRAPAEQPLAQGHRAEWAASLALAECNANRWRKQPYVDTIEVLDAIQV
jgi:hypothetical protein